VLTVQARRHREAVQPKIDQENPPVDQERLAIQKLTAGLRLLDCPG
jgi:hypothetical protein